MISVSASRLDIIEAFRSDVLDSERGIYVYLPEGYDEDEERTYPVIYAHAGQRVFPIAKRLPSWELQETLDTLIADEMMEPVIVVAIAFLKPKPAVRSKNDFFYPLPEFEKNFEMDGNGLCYSRFIIDELLPEMESRYRVAKESSRRLIIGSSSGATTSYHMAMENPNIFGMVAMMSSALFLPANNRKVQLYRLYRNTPKVKMWLDIGDAEDGFEVQDAYNFAMQMQDKGYVNKHNFAFHVEQGAEHSEYAWRVRARLPLLYFFGTDKGKELLEINDGLLLNYLS